MTLEDIETTGFSQSLKALGKRPATIDSYRRDIKKLQTFLANSGLATRDIDADIITAFIEWLQGQDKHNSVRRNIIGVRQFYRYLADLDGSWDSPFDQVVIPTRDETLPEGLLEDDIDCLEAAALSQKSKLKRARDLAILRLLALEGLKANEILQIKNEHVLQTAATTSLQVQGTKQRTIALAAETGQAMAHYLDIYQGEPATSQFEYLFISFKGRDLSLLSEPMTRHGLKFLLYELGEDSGISHLNSELLRHFAIHHQIQLGKSSAEIMAHLGLKRLGNVGKHLYAEKTKN